MVIWCPEWEAHWNSPFQSCLWTHQPLFFQQGSISNCWPAEQVKAENLCPLSPQQTLMMGQDLGSVERMLRPAESFYLRQWRSSRTWTILGRSKQGAKRGTAGSSPESRVATNEDQWWQHHSRGLEPGEIGTEWGFRQVKQEAVCCSFLWAIQRDHHDTLPML